MLGFARSYLGRFWLRLRVLTQGVGCEFLLAPDFGQLMRDPTSLFQAQASPVGASAFVATGYPSSFLSYSFFRGAGGRAYVFCYACPLRSFIAYSIVYVFCSTDSLRSFYRMLSYSYSVLSILFVCSLLSILVLLSYLPILSVLPCLAFLLAQPSSAVLPPLSVFSVGAVSVCSPCLSSVLGSERSSLRSRGILLYPLCHKAFEPVDNFVFSVDIY